MRAMPPTWVNAELGEIVAPLSDGRTIHQGWSPQCLREPSESEEVWGVLKTTSIQPGQFLPEHNKRLPELTEARPLIEVSAGDLLITCAGPRSRCGVACLVRSTRRRLLMSGKMYRFRFDERYLDSRFVEAFLLSSEAWDAIDKMKTGGSDSGQRRTGHDYNRQCNYATKMDNHCDPCLSYPTTRRWRPRTCIASLTTTSVAREECPALEDIGALGALGHQHELFVVRLRARLVA